MIFEHLTTAAIALLFFMHVAKLSREAILSGIGHWKLHVVVFLSTLALFPLLCLAMQVFVPTLLSSSVYMGFFYLCALPATVQSAIAFTSVAGGNVAAVIYCALASSILGVFIIAGAGWAANAHPGRGSGSHDTLHAISSIILQLMVPFIIGHLSRPLIGGWVSRYKKLVNMTDRSSILLVVYVAFSAAVVEGIWQKITGWTLVVILAFSLVLLAVVLVASTYASRWMGFEMPDEITIVFCSSKKSLANGIPMANVLFPSAMVGTLVLSLMIFHQGQLMVWAVLAQRYAPKQAALAAAVPDGPGSPPRGAPCQRATQAGVGANIAWCKHKSSQAYVDKIRGGLPAWAVCRRQIISSACFSWPKRRCSHSGLAIARCSCAVPSKTV